MEIIIGLIVIVVVCKILGVSNFILILCGLGIIELIIILLFIFFVFHTINIFFSKEQNAVFTKFDSVKKNEFEVAFYEIDGVEYPCVFPKESKFTNAYSTENICSVRYSKRLKKVYDKWAIATCVVGLVFSVIAVVITFSIIVNFKYIL